ncbi:hypothetical protein KI688_002162 [Linnemannia hyalina]|uniref:Uncharacterized protein n=1 Tax=Linnemannia hyalina TaxID=64524 RepID=A0A9P7XR46_9FUNG|nr:hypothetical protein KI688_002162 [Linnemannia hyalina]
MSSLYYTYLTTTEGAYRTTEPEPRPTPAAPPPPASPPPPPQRPNPNPAPNPTTTDPTTTEALPPPAAKSASKDSSTTTTEAGSQQTHGVSENEPTTTTTTTSTANTTRDDGGGGATARGGSSPTLPLSPERTTSDDGSSPKLTGVQPPSSPPGAQSTNGGITLQAGSTMVFHNPSGVSSTPTPAISGSVISAPMTGVVFTFAFLGALIIGLVAGFIIAKYTRLGGGGGGGGGRSRRQQRDELTEQVRLLIDTIGQRDSRNFDNGPQQPYRHDRSYLDDEKFAHASVTHQGERMPLYMNGRQSIASTITAAHGGDGGETERLHPHSIPDQNQYQDWELINSHLISPHSNNVPLHPMSFSRHSAMISPLTGIPTTNRASRPEPSGAGTFLSPRVVHLPPTQLPPDVEIYGPKGEWG